MENLCGILNVYKEKGYTSNDVVKIIKKITNASKVGHTGTLDPDAEGVLPICLGKATKITEYIMSSKKVYIATVTLGTTTTTQDSQGEILKQREVLATKAEIESAVKSFIGQSYQVPPMYSAIKVNGKRLYELARKGQEVQRKPRMINIYSISIENFIDNKNFEIVVECSKGTYIRTLCNDIGEKLGCGAYMKSLIRTKTGNFNIEESLNLDNLREIVDKKQLDNHIIKIEDVLKELNTVTVSSSAKKYLYNGNKISLNYIKDKIDLSQNQEIFVYDENKNLIGIYEVFSEFIKPLIMLV